MIRFVGPLEIVTTSNSGAIANSHALQFPIACTKSSHFALASSVIA